MENFKEGDWVTYFGIITTIDFIPNEKEVVLGIHSDEMQPDRTPIDEIKHWKPEEDEICVFFENENEFRNTHYVISLYGGYNKDNECHLAKSNRVYYENVRPLGFTATLKRSDFKVIK